MKRLRRAVFFLLPVLTVLLTACAKRTDVGGDDSYIYSLNTDRTGLVKITFEFDEEDPLEQAEAILKEMKKTSFRD